jgi:hypothetical protein
VHKAAVRLYNAEKQKPDCLSIRQVQVVIKAKYKVCPSKATISCYTKQGLVNASPMKMGPISHIFGGGIQVCMPGVLQPSANQPDERVRQRQFPEDDNLDASKNVQHLHWQDKGAFQLSCLQHGYQDQR